MESTPLSPKNDPENGFAGKKPKAKQKRFEVGSEEDELTLRQSRHLAREALRLEETESLEEASEPHEHRHRAPEAGQLHGSDPLERIGHVIVTAEATNQATAAHEQSPPVPDKRIDTLTRPELLSLSEQIIVEGTSLRQVFETHLIGEHALRRLITEYFHGNDVRAALQKEILEHEIDFERDPALRDKANGTDADNGPSATDSAKETLNQLLQKATAGLFGNDDETISYGASETHEEKNLEQDSKQQERVETPTSVRRPVDIVMAATIVGLVILVILLYFWRR